MKILKGVVNLWLIIILLLGMFYQVKAKSGNINMIFLYITGDTSLAVQAYIYTIILEAIFIAFATLGSMVLLILFNLGYKKILVYICVQFVTLVSYIFRYLLLIMATLHMATNGAIKNTDMSNIGFALQKYSSDAETIIISAFLLLGTIFLPVLINKYFLIKEKRNIHIGNY